MEVPFPEAPAPWTVKADWFICIGYVSSSKAKKSYPPAAAFNELEASSSYADPKITGEFKGKWSLLHLIRYSETPVGPYDELIWMPGFFHSPHTGEDALRITRIYVSSLATTYNGRKNWNIPKTLAHFTFTPAPNAGPNSLPYSRVSLAPLSDQDEPFFSINLTPTRFFSNAVLPYSQALLPFSTKVILPPLPESPDWRKNGLVGTDKWSGVMTKVHPCKAGLFWHEGGLEDGKYADDKGMEDVRPWKLGVWLKDVQADFPVAEWWDEEGKKTA